MYVVPGHHKSCCLSAGDEDEDDSEDEDESSEEDESFDDMAKPQREPSVIIEDITDQEVGGVTHIKRQWEPSTSHSPLLHMSY